MAAQFSFFDIIWTIFIISAFLPMLKQQHLEMQRMRLIRAIEQKRRSRLITMIHRQELLSLLGLPLTRYINIEDSEHILRAIRYTPPDMPIDLLLHTPGGLVLAAEQIARALEKHPAKVTVFIPHYAMSGGTMIALAADEIVMDENAVLGPVDPQLGSLPRGSWPAASILKALEQDNPNRDDETLILGDVARKAIDQVRATVRELLDGRVPDDEADRLAALLSEGRWTHDYPIRLEEARRLGLPVSDDVPELVYELMGLYPRRSQRRPSVEFIPTPYRARGRRE